MFFDALVENIKKYRGERNVLVEGEPKEKNLIVMMNDLEEFVGIDMKNYGPFKKGDVANLPEENTKLLIEKKVAKRIEAQESEASI